MFRDHWNILWFEQAIVAFWAYQARSRDITQRGWKQGIENCPKIRQSLPEYLTFEVLFRLVLKNFKVQWLTVYSHDRLFNFGCKTGAKYLCSLCLWYSQSTTNQAIGKYQVHPRFEFSKSLSGTVLVSTCNCTHKTKSTIVLILQLECECFVFYIQQLCLHRLPWIPFTFDSTTSSGFHVFETQPIGFKPGCLFFDYSVFSCIIPSHSRTCLVTHNLDCK